MIPLYLANLPPLVGALLVDAMLVQKQGQGPSDPRKEQAKQEFESLATLSEDPCLTNWSRSMASNGDTIDTIHLCNKIPKIPKMDTKISSIPHQSFASGVAILKPWIYSVGSIESRERVPCVRKPALRRSRPFDIKPQPWKL